MAHIIDGNVKRLFLKFQLFTLLVPKLFKQTIFGKKNENKQKMTSKLDKMTVGFLKNHVKLQCDSIKDLAPLLRRISVPNTDVPTPRSLPVKKTRQL